MKIITFQANKKSPLVAPLKSEGYAKVLLRIGDRLLIK